MGLSFHDEVSIVEASTGSLRFALYISNSIPGIEGINIVDEERRNDDIQIQLSDGFESDI